MHIHSPNWSLLSQKVTANLARSALVPSFIFTILAFIIVLLRWVSRICLVPGKCYREDFLVTAAMLMSIAMTAVVGAEYSIDMASAKDKHAALHRLPKMLKLVFAQSLLYQLAINFVKTAFVYQYLQIFSHLRYPKYCCYLLLIFIVSATAWGVFGVVFLCDPVKTYWDVKVDGRCMNAEHHFWSTSIIGIVIDWAIWILPMPIVGKLKLPRRQKWGLWGVFGLGGFVCIVSVLRLTLVQNAAHEGEMTSTYAIVWSTIELNVAIICASLLVMKPLFARCIPAIVSEQPMTAAEDRRALGRLTGLVLLAGQEDEEKADEQVPARRDTGIAGVGRGDSEHSGLPERPEVVRTPMSSWSTDSSSHQ